MRRAAAWPRRLPRDGSHVRDGGLELGAHLVERLDRDDAMPEGDERTRELAGARAEVDDVDGVVSDHPANRLLRVARPAALVRAGHFGERRVRAAHLVVAVDDHRRV